MRNQSGMLLQHFFKRFYYAFYSAIARKVSIPTVTCILMVLVDCLFLIVVNIQNTGSFVMNGDEKIRFIRPNANIRVHSPTVGSAIS